jgi:hypothetical protein
MPLTMFTFMLNSLSVLIVLSTLAACTIRIEPGQSESAESASSIPPLASPNLPSATPGATSSQSSTQRSSSENASGPSSSENKGIFRTGSVSFDLINKTGRSIERFCKDSGVCFGYERRHISLTGGCRSHQSLLEEFQCGTALGTASLNHAQQVCRLCKALH